MANFTPVGVIAEVRGFNDFQSKLGRMSKAVGGVAKTAAKVAITGFAALGAAATGVAAASIKAAIDFETAWAGVTKTTEGLTDEFGNLTRAGEKIQQGFRDLAKEVPVSVEELMAIGELGGQLGIAEDQLVEFTRTIAALGETTNLTTEEAAAGFARIANIMDVPREAAAEMTARMGSAVVELGNNFATTERDILSFAERIAGAGKIAGLTESDILAIGAAMSSVGVQAEAGGTAVQKVLLAMNEAVLSGSEDLETFAAVAGMSATDFSEAWETDAGAAFNEFVTGLGLAGDDALGILDALDLKDQRLVRSFLSLAGAGDLLTETMESSSEAFADNTALTEEADKRYRTTAAQFQIFKNTIKDVAITIGNALLPFINKLLKAAKPLIEEFGKRLPKFLDNVLVPAIEKVADWLGESIPRAIQFLGNIWTSVLQPALTQFWQFAVTTLIPALQQIFNWLATNIPVAIQTLSQFWTGTLQPALATAWTFIKESLIPAFKEFVAFLIDNLIPMVKETAAVYVERFTIIADWFKENLPLIMRVVQKILARISEFWERHGENIMNFVRNAWETINNIINTAINAVLGIIKTVLQIIDGDWEGAWETLKSTAETLWEEIKGAIKIVAEALQTVIGNILDAIKTKAGEIWEDVKTAAAMKWAEIRTAVIDKVNSIFAKIVAKMIKIRDTIEQKWTEARQAVVDKLIEIRDEVKERIQGVIDFLVGLYNKFKEVGGEIVNKIKEGIEAAWDGLVQWFRDRLDDLTDWLPWSSPPRDPRSPLHRLFSGGVGIVEEITAGMVAAAGTLQSQMRAASIAAGSAGGAAAASTVSMAPVAAGGGSTFNLNTTVNSGMDHAQFEARVMRVIQRALRQ